MNGSITFSKVDFYRAGSTPPIGTATTSPYTITWSNVPAGSYSLTAKATNAAGASATSSAVAITVTTPTNKAPTVSITNPANNAVLAAPASFTISATAIDTDGTIAKVVFYDGATSLGTVNGSTATLNASLPVNLAAGTHVLTTVATDNAGANTTSAPVTVTLDLPPRIALTAPRPCNKFIGPATISISAETDDLDGAVVTVAFYANGTLLYTDTSNATFKSPGVSGSSYQWTNVPNGTYALTAVATDDLGLSTTSSSVTITVAPDAPPTVSISSPGNGASSTAGFDVQVSASAVDSDGTVTKVDFYANGSLIGTTSNAPYWVNWTPTVPGTASLTAVATDNGGFMATSAAVQINITPSHAPPTVSVSAATDTNPAYAPSIVHLTASATATAGFNISTIAFYNNNTLIGTGTASLMDWLAHASGSYSLTAMATDNTGETGTSAPVTVTLNPSTVTHLHTDFLGSPIIGTSTSGAVAWKMHYAPFGERLDTNATQRVGYTGQPYDAESGLAYHHARYYDATIGRFYGIDPIDVKAGDINSFNRYSYADNNPYAKYDPSGRTPIGLLIGGGIGYFAGAANGWLVGDSAYQIWVTDGLAGAATGGIIGLTDGLGLLAGVGVNATAGAGIEALRQESNYGEIKSKSSVFLAGMGGVLGPTSTALGNEAMLANESASWVGDVLNATVAGELAGGAGTAGAAVDVSNESSSVPLDLQQDCSASGSCALVPSDSGKTDSSGPSVDSSSDPNSD